MRNNGKYDWSNKEKFLEDLRLSTSMSNFLNNCNLDASSGNFNTFKKWVLIHNIDIQNFNYKRKLKTYKKPLKYKFLQYNDYFCKNSVLSISQVKNKILKDKLINYQCGCGLTNEWNGKPLSLQLEHKNGDNKDNRLENLEFLCPNCHTQTSTYGSKNKFIRNLKIKVEKLGDIKNINKDNIEMVAELWNCEAMTCLLWVIERQKELENVGVTTTLNKKEVTKIIKSRNKKDFVKFYDFNSEEREQQLSFIINKKEVQKLASLWGLCTKGAKKWIRENYPEKFKEIYDEKLLQKNKKRAVKDAKIDFLKNASVESFDIEIFINDYGGNKSAVYSMLKKYNLALFNELSKKQKCLYCKGKTRTRGTVSIKSGNYVRYSCLDCNKHFYFI